MVFFVSVILTLVLIFLNTKHNFGSDVTLGQQKFHEDSIPRTGGMAVFLSFFIFGFLLEIPNVEEIFLPAIILFSISFYEDLNQSVKPLIRLIIIIISSIFLVLNTEIGVYGMGFWILDYMLANPIVNIIFTSITIALVTNSFNMIDGFNGLISGFSLMVLAVIMYIANSIGDVEIYSLSTMIFLSILGFMVFNFPFGKIFLGDAGAYFLGFLISYLLIELSHNKDISIWLGLSLLIYPVFELIFSIIRKKFLFNSSPLHPDKFHLHMLIFRNIVRCSFFKNKKEFCNSFTSILTWLFALPSIGFSAFWYLETVALFYLSVSFIVYYVFVYFATYQLEKNKK